MTAMGSCARPVPETVKVAFCGRLLTRNSRLVWVAAIPPLTPMTKLKCSGCGMTPFAASLNVMSTMPLSNTSHSGLTFFSVICRAKFIIVFSVLTKMSSPPKLQVPQSSVAVSGFRARGCKRSSSLMPTAPPVDG